MEPSVLFSGLSGFGILAAGCGFAYAQFKTGAGKAKDELLATYKDAVDIEKKKNHDLEQEKNTLVASHQTQINELTLQIGKLQGMVEAQDKKLKEYTNILQGRSPDQQKFMEYVTTVATGAVSYMKESAVILSEIKEFMIEMNAEIKKGNVFNAEIEEATAKGQGKALRKQV